ncbi:RIO1-domain-containing protein [Lentinus tigrinus ALCF2SS1-7]|uniref:Serine/threonine-protein kinase RIO1 n=1 Tax=Lentinus tigrinus ALCF2SS1-6 TaxID=1328759 RepID=A0A5C2SF83_9APHY|nr:RIO1-domain-containing protein [Lentinus tigrinus ALCF2SS1-6]RPD77834.1 RIO1-domain-containing protein [Lentinus tigrinus ALCF2SS1-7]
MPADTITAVPEITEEGQFDDAPDDHTAPTPADPRQGHNYIDDEGLLEWSSESSEDEESEPDEFEEEEDTLEAEAFQTLRAEDEDWEIAERDFTKQYNRLRQHVAVRTGAAQGVASAINAKAVVAALPAVNRPRPPKVKDAQTRQQEQEHSKDKTENQLQALSKYSSRLRNLDMPYDLGVGVNRKGPSATANMKDKSDRATNEQVLDSRTRIILFKMIGRGLVYEVNGCVSTGKEANVYHALTPERKHLALKIYKTSILVFKDRDRYVSGEFRFRRGYSRHNPRKMVRVWAEKEMRNLKRLRTADIRCPEPIEVRENVLAMTFVGDRDGWASPRLKDADIPQAAFPDLYVELMLMTRKMFIECKLVHADLSEYNILYHIEDDSSPPEPSGERPDSAAVASAPEEQPLSEPPRGHLWIIDVSQSVEHDHPHAFDFLRADLRNIEDFFSKRGVRTVGLRRAFEFITREQLSADGSKSEEEVLREWMDTSDSEETDATGGSSAANSHDDEVFMHSYIPRTLNEVYDPERDVDVLARGEGEKLIYKDTIGIVGLGEVRKDGAPDSVGTNGKPANAQKKGVTFADEAPAPAEDDQEDAAAEDGEESEDGEDDSQEEDGGESNAFKERKPRGHRHEDKEAKKVSIWRRTASLARC